MIIEDNDDIINIVTKIAISFNVKVEIGRNTADYIKLTKKFRFNCILCDIALDYTDEGFDIVKLHKKKKSKTKIIAFTSRKIEPERIKAYGFDSYLEKNSVQVTEFVKKLSMS